MALQDNQNFKRSMQAWTAARTAEIAALHVRQCCLSEKRFRHPGDDRRIAFLGTLIIVFSAIALADVIDPGRIQGGFSGGSAIFGGVSIVLFITKISRRDMYVDWVLLGAVYSAAGAILAAAPNVDRVSFLVGFLVCLLGSGAMRAWIASTVSPRHAAAWILASGAFAAMGAGWFFFIWNVTSPDWGLVPSHTPALVLALDTLFLGISIVWFGQSLRDGR